MCCSFTRKEAPSLSVIVAPWCMSVVCFSVLRFGLALVLGNPAHMEIAQTLQKQLLGGSEIARLSLKLGTPSRVRRPPEADARLLTATVGAAEMRIDEVQLQGSELPTCRADKAEHKPYRKRRCRDIDD